MAIFLDSPRRIHRSGQRCWAAAATSWSEVSPDSSDRSLRQLQRSARERGVVTLAGALKKEVGVEWLAEELGLHCEVGASMFLNMEERLEESHVIYLYRKHRWRTAVQAEVIWGIDEEYACTMDPQQGKWTFPDLAALDQYAWEMCLWRKK